MPQFYKALNELHSDHPLSQFDEARDYLTFLLFSGCRMEEAAKLQPADVDVKRRIFILRDPKNRAKDTELPLNDQLTSIIVRRLETGDSYIFPDTTGTNPIQRPKKALTALQKTSGVSFTPHDLRRTFRTVAAKIALPMKIGMQLVNHSINGELKVDLDYIQVEPEELLEASNLVANEIMRQAQESTP